ncbi:hypothetical protein J6590_104813, partial [Homalodisca vitripennis]
IEVTPPKCSTAKLYRLDRQHVEQTILEFNTKTKLDKIYGKKIGEQLPHICDQKHHYQLSSLQHQPSS